MKYQEEIALKTVILELQKRDKTRGLRKFNTSDVREWLGRKEINYSQSAFYRFMRKLVCCGIATKQPATQGEKATYITNQELL